MTRRDEIVGAENCWIGLNGTIAEGWGNGNVYDRIFEDVCIKTLSDGSWRQAGCTGRMKCFVCSFKKGRRTLRGKQNLTLEYKPSELPLPLINITFVYNDTHERVGKKIEDMLGGQTLLLADLQRRYQTQWVAPPILSLGFAKFEDLLLALPEIFTLRGKGARCCPFVRSKLSEFE